MMTEQVPEIQEKPIQAEVVSEVKPRKTPLKTLLLVILGLFVMAGAVYAGMKIQEKKQAPTPSAKITPSQSIPTAIPIIDPTAGWKTYTNTKNGFELKYPSKWFIREIKREITDCEGCVSIIMSSHDESKMPWPESRAKIELTMFGNFKNFLARDWYKEWSSNPQDPQPQIISNEDVFIGGADGVKIMFEAPPVEVLQTMVLSAKRKIYYFWIGGSKEYGSILDQILATFKFLE